MPNGRNGHRRLQKGDAIVCLSDVSQVPWKVIEEKRNGDVVAIVAPGQRFPSPYYPHGPLMIERHAQNDWQKQEPSPP